MESTGREQGRGFQVARELLGSSVQRRVASVYDLDPDVLGEFDVVTCGSLLLHLRDPLRGLERIRSVCRGHYLSAEAIDLSLSILAPRRAVLRFDGMSDLFQWFTPSAAAHRRMLRAAGFTLERWTRPYAIPFGVGHTPRSGLRHVGLAMARRVLAGGVGVPHQAVLARP
jgi:tRNA (mo5U34)-methyltransferase